MNRKNKDLPIDQHKEEIQKLVADNDVIIIVSPTGSGKTIRVPQYLLGQCAGLIGVTQHGDFGARVVDQHVSKYGFCSDRIRFMTMERMIEAINNNKEEYGAIVIDDVQKNNLFADSLLLQLKLLQTQKQSKLKIILSSATMNPEKFQNYFKDFRVGYLKATCQNTSFPITISYIEDLYYGTTILGIVQGLTNYDPQKVNKNNLFNQNLNKIPFIIDQFPDIKNDDAGAVIVFLSCIGDILLVTEILENFSMKNGKVDDWHILPFHENLDSEVQENIFEIFRNKRKIILSTNIGENSITIPDLTYVIDLCTTRRMLHDDSVNLTCLVPALSSKQQAIQRAGRVGRTRAGFCIRLVTKSFYDTQMPAEILPEMQHCGLDLAFLMMEYIASDNNTPKEMLKQLMHPPTLQPGSLLSVVLDLKEKGALTTLMSDGSYDPYNGKLTTIGRISIILSCDPIRARIIAFGRLLNLFEESIIIAMSINKHSIFCSFPNDKVHEAMDSYLEKFHLTLDIKSDAISALAAFMFYIELKQRNSDWIYKLKERYIKSSAIQRLDFEVNRTIRKLSKYVDGVPLMTFGQYYYNNNKTDPNYMNSLIILITMSSVPNLFYRPPVKSIQKFQKIVQQEIFNFDPKSTIILQPQNSCRPSLSQEEYLRTKLNKILKYSVVDPIYRWNYALKILVIQLPLQMITINDGIPFDLYRAIKFKLLNQQFKWMDNQQAVLLDGPRSPLQIKFKSVRHSTFAKLSIIDRESMNAISIDDSYPECNGYGIAALYCKNQLILKNTTRIPKNNGAFATIMMLLNPFVQIKYFNNSIIGCIAGIMNKESYSSSFQFDAEFNSDDITEIDNIRMGFNELLNWDNFKLNDSTSISERSEWTRHFIPCIQKRRTMKRNCDFFQKFTWDIDDAQSTDSTTNSNANILSKIQNSKNPKK